MFHEYISTRNGSKLCTNVPNLKSFKSCSVMLLDTCSQDLGCTWAMVSFIKTVRNLNAHKRLS